MAKFSREELTNILNNKNITNSQANKLKKILSIETENREVIIPDGFKFLEDLRNEAKRQLRLSKTKTYDIQALDIDKVPESELQIRQELDLSDSFEIIEE